MILQCLCSHNPFFNLLMVPKQRSSDAGNLDLPKNIHEVLLLSEKEKVLDLMKKNHMLRLLIYNMKNSVYEVVRRKRNLLMWYITLIDLWILKNPCIPGIKPTWS